MATATPTTVTATAAVTVGTAIASGFTINGITVGAITATTGSSIGADHSAKIAAASALASATVGTSVTAVAGTTIGTAAATVTGGIVSVPSAIGLGIEGVKFARPYVFQTEHEEFVYLEKSERQEFLQQRSDLINCLIKNKKDSKKGSFDCSPSCQQLAFEFQLLAGKTELQRAVKSV